MNISIAKTTPVCNLLFSQWSAIMSSQLHTTTPLLRVVSGKYRITKKRDRPLTYEMANAPHYIAHRKSWNSWNTSSLKDGLRRSETAVEDEFIRRFMTGTWHGLVCSEVIIKRQFNHIRVAAIVRRAVSPTKMYFLLGYTEELLANWLQCPVTLELQTVDSFQDVVFNETAGRAAKYQAPPELLHIRYDDPLYSAIPRTSYEPTRYTADALHPFKDLIAFNKHKI